MPSVEPGELTELQKEALRLVYDRYAAGQIARRLNISVHSVNDRLRSARRALGVSSSIEAAQLLIEAERLDPQPLAREPFGVAATGAGGPSWWRSGPPWPWATRRRPSRPASLVETLVSITIVSVLTLGVFALYVLAVGLLTRVF